MAQPTQKYLFIHRSATGAEPPDRAAPSPEQMQAMFARWNAWKQKWKDHIVDMGDKLESTGKVVTASGVSDGPFVEAKEIVGGFMIVAAASVDDAVAIAREMPVRPDARIEIRKMLGATM
jgi:hypothetical protein